MKFLESLNINSDTILSISAIIIAVASICVSLWEGTETRKHYRLSVRPKLEIIYITNMTNFGYVAVNNGLGPAIISGKKIFIDGEEIKYTGFSGFDDFLEKLGLNDRRATHGVVSPGFTIKAGEQEPIIVLNTVEDDNIDSLIAAVYRRVGIEIQYESMYEESFACKTSNR